MYTWWFSSLIMVIRLDSDFLKVGPCHGNWLWCTMRRGNELLAHAPRVQHLRGEQYSVCFNGHARTTTIILSRATAQNISPLGCAIANSGWISMLARQPTHTLRLSESSSGSRHCFFRHLTWTTFCRQTTPCDVWFIFKLHGVPILGQTNVCIIVLMSKLD